LANATSAKNTDVDEINAAILNSFPGEKAVRQNQF
jgi:hypothetical protein